MKQSIRVGAGAVAGLLVVFGMSGPAAASQGRHHAKARSVVDRDHDGMPDAWERAHGLNPRRNDAKADPDHDGLTNLQEYLVHTNPRKADTDGDGISDGDEDSNGDGQTNKQEFEQHNN